MAQPDPSHITMLDRILEFLTVALVSGGAGAGGTHVFHRRRRNGSNGRATLADVVAAVEKMAGTVETVNGKTQDKIAAGLQAMQQAIRDEGAKTREELGKTRVVIREANKEELQVIRETSAAHLAAVTKAHDAQIGVCQAQVIRAEQVISNQKRLLREIEDRSD